MKRTFAEIWYWMRRGFWYWTYPWSFALFTPDLEEFRQEEKAWLKREPKRYPKI